MSASWPETCKPLKAAEGFFVFLSKGLSIILLELLDDLQTFWVEKRYLMRRASIVTFLYTEHWWGTLGDSGESIGGERGTGGSLGHLGSWAI